MRSHALVRFSSSGLPRLSSTGSTAWVQAPHSPMKMYVEAHIRAELEEQVLDLGVGGGGRPSLFWRLALVVLWYDYRAIGRLVPFGGPGTTGREPAQRPYNRVSLSFPQCTHDRFAVRRLPPDWTSPEWSLPPVRVIQPLKDGELVAHIQDWNPLLWRER